MIYPTLSIRQPWAWAILHAGKNIENRTWKLPEKYIGVPVLMHSGGKNDPDANPYFYPELNKWMRGELTPGERRGAEKGGIIGSVVFVCCTFSHGSRWAGSFCFNWVIGKAIALPFYKCKGRLGFFEVDYPEFRF